MIQNGPCVHPYLEYRLATKRLTTTSSLSKNQECTLYVALEGLSNRRVWFKITEDLKVLHLSPFLADINHGLKFAFGLNSQAVDVFFCVLMLNALIVNLSISPF